MKRMKRMKMMRRVVTGKRETMMLTMNLSPTPLTLTDEPTPEQKAEIQRQLNQHQQLLIQGIEVGRHSGCVDLVALYSRYVQQLVVQFMGTEYHTQLTTRTQGVTGMKRLLSAMGDLMDQACADCDAGVVRGRGRGAKSGEWMGDKQDELLACAVERYATLKSDGSILGRR